MRTSTRTAAVALSTTLAAGLLAAGVQGTASAAGTSTAPKAHTKTVTYDGFAGDDVRVTVNYRTAPDNGGSVRIVDARLTPLIASTGQVDRARGYADATLRVTTRAGREVRNTGEVGIGGTEGTLFRLGDLTQRNEGMALSILLDVRGVQKNVRIPLA